MSALELIYDFYEDHVRAAAVVNERKPVALAVLCFLLAAVSLFTAQALTQRLNLLSFAWPSLLLAIGWKLFAAFMLVALVHLILDMQGRKGSAAALFVLFGLAELVWTIALPGAIIVRALTGSALAVTGVFLAVGLLSFSLKARSLQDNYHISAGRAWTVLGLPYIALFVGIMVAFSLAIVSLIQRLVQSFQ